MSIASLDLIILSHLLLKHHHHHWSIVVCTMLGLFCSSLLTTLWFFFSLSHLLNLFYFPWRSLMIWRIVDRWNIWVLLAPIKMIIYHLSLLKLLNLRIMSRLSIWRRNIVTLSIARPWHYLVEAWRANLVLMRREHWLLLHNCIHAWARFKLISVKSVRVLSRSVVSVAILSLTLIIQILRLFNLSLILVLFRRFFLLLLVVHLMVLTFSYELLLNQISLGIFNLKLFG